MKRTNQIVLAPMAVLLAIALGGCSDESASPVMPLDGSTMELGDGDSEMGRQRLGLGGAKLQLTTTDPDDFYVTNSQVAWFRRSTVTESESFDLRITNTGSRTAHDLELLVAIPEGLPEHGWSVTVAGQALSSLTDFDHTSLNDSHYPWMPHQVHQPQGSGRYALLQGPETLEAGATWEVPVQLYRGSTEGFMVHFDAAGRGVFCSPMADVTAEPPLTGEEEVTDGGAVGRVGGGLSE